MDFVSSLIHVQNEMLGEIQGKMAEVFEVFMSVKMSMAD
jgi:hypothetical protein